MACRFADEPVDIREAVEFQKKQIDVFLVVGEADLPYIRCRSGTFGQTRRVRSVPRRTRTGKNCRQDRTLERRRGHTFLFGGNVGKGLLVALCKRYRVLETTVQCMHFHAVRWLNGKHHTATVPARLPGQANPETSGAGDQETLCMRSPPFPTLEMCFESSGQAGLFEQLLDSLLAPFFNLSELLFVALEDDCDRSVFHVCLPQSLRILSSVPSFFDGDQVCTGGASFGS